MKLLITTQVVDYTDPALGFFCRWIEEFAKHCERIEVICLYEGKHHLPENVSVHSLGKENQTEGQNAVLTQLRYAVRFKMLSFKLRKNYDGVFVHMNPEYVILDGIFWHLWKKRIGLWYVHKSVDLKLRLAVLLTNAVFTASKESFRFHSPKVHVVGHGIALDEFPEPAEQVRAEADSLRLVTVGRVSPSKKVDRILDALDVLIEKSVPFTFDSIGAAGRPEDQPYVEELKAHVGMTSLQDHVRFLGAIPHAEIAPALAGNYDLFLHASTGTGSVDKAVLEALLSGVPVISTSEAFRDLLTPYGLFVREGAGKETGVRIAAAITEFTARTDTDKEEIRKKLRAHVAREYSLEALVPRILTLLSSQEPSATIS